MLRCVLLCVCAVILGACSDTGFDPPAEGYVSVLDRKPDLPLIQRSDMQLGAYTVDGSAVEVSDNDGALTIDVTENGRSLTYVLHPNGRKAMLYYTDDYAQPRAVEIIAGEGVDLLNIELTAGSATVVDGRIVLDAYAPLANAVAAVPPIDGGCCWAELAAHIGASLVATTAAIAAGMVCINPATVAGCPVAAGAAIGAAIQAGVTSYYLDECMFQNQCWMYGGWSSLDPFDPKRLRLV